MSLLVNSTVPRQYFLVLTPIFIASLFLMGFAIYNYYPILFATDSVTYLSDGQHFFRRLWFGPAQGWPASGRPVYYGVAVFPLHLGRNLWPIIVVQGLIAAHLMHLTLRCIDRRLTAVHFVSIVAILTLVSPVSWYISQVVPDIFAGFLILGMFLLGYCANQLTRWEKVYLVLLTCGAIAFHVSHLVISLALFILGVIVWSAIPASRERVRPLLLGLPVLLGTFALLAYPWIVRHQVSLAPNSLPWTLAHMWANGPAKSYVESNCGVINYTLCDYKNDIPAGSEWDFLWGPNSPVMTSDFQAIRDESNSIVLGTIATYPMWVAKTTGQNWVEQLLTFQSEELFSDRDRVKLRNVLPLVEDGFSNSLQASGGLSSFSRRMPEEVEPRGAHSINRVYYFFIAVTVVLIGLLIYPLWRRARASLLAALLTITVGILSNAFIVAAVSGVAARYNGRVIWLLPFWLLIAGSVLLHDLNSRRWKKPQALLLTCY